MSLRNPIEKGWKSKHISSSLAGTAPFHIILPTTSPASKAPETETGMPRTCPRMPTLWPRDQPCGADCLEALEKQAGLQGMSFSSCLALGQRCKDGSTQSITQLQPAAHSRPRCAVARPCSTGYEDQIGQRVGSVGETSDRPWCWQPLFHLVPLRHPLQRQWCEYVSTCLEKMKILGV